MTRPGAILATSLFAPCLVVPGLPGQVINEIMYHPREETAPGVEDKRFEWIELYNPDPDPVDLSGYTLKGISFTFPPGEFLAGRAYLVVCADEASMQAKYGLDGAVTIGNWIDSALDNSGERITLANVSGVTISTLAYNDRGRWPAAADGTGHSLSLRSPFLEVDDPDHWTLSAALGGSPGAPNFGGQATVRDTVFIQDSETWRYLKGTAAPPANWNTVGFNDSGWLSGPTGIGYGDGDDRTVLDDMMGAGGYLTVFCRKRFTVGDPAAVKQLVLTVSYDDGFYAYLNGTEVASRNVNSKAFNAPASATVPEASPEDIDISGFKGLLTAGGNNVLAVQVHNVGPDSTDLSFIPRLASRETISPEAVATVPVVINEGLIHTAGERWIELYNTQAAPVDLSGFHLTDDRLQLDKAKLPPNTSIPGRGFLALSDSALGLNFSLASPAPRERVFVALVNSAATRVVDAFTFKPEVAERSEARIPDGDEDVEPASLPTRGAANVVEVVGGGDIVINEIMYHPLSNDPEDEFIELLNRGAGAVNLRGFAFTKGVEYLFGDVVLPPGEHLVVARNPARIQSTYGLPAGKVLGPWYRQRQDAAGNPIQEPATLADRGERITLQDPWGNTADTVRYGEGGEWPFWPDGRGSSLELIDPFQDNNTAQAWDSSDDSAESSPRTFTYAGRHAGGESELQILLLDRGIAVVDSLSVKSGATEHVPNGTFEAGDAGWVMEGTHINSGHTADPDLVIDGGGSLKVVATGGGDNKVNRIETRPDLSPLLNTTSTYTVGFKARWIVGSRALMTRGYNHGLARSHVLDVPSTLGTPGALNSVSARQTALAGEPNLGPVIDKVVHDPVVPEASQGVTVSARVRDADGIRPGTVRLLYALNTPPAAAGGFTAVAMTDPDGDGRWSGTIPGQPLATRVLYFITAQDDSPGRLPGRYPLDHAARTHAALLDPAAAGLADHRYAIYRHDTRLPSTRHHSYRFVMHQANEDYLWTRRVHSNDLVDGAFIFGAERSYYGARIRWAGSPWLRSRSWGNSYRVRFPGDDLLHGSTKSFNLENHGTSGRERISHYLIRYQNVPGIKVPYALQLTYARWQVNGNSIGTFEHTPQPDNDYIALWYPDEDDGDFFEMDDRFEFNDNGDRASNQDGRMTYPPYPNSIYPTPDPAQGYASWKENYRWYLNVRSKPSGDDFTNLIEFSKVLDPVRTANAAFDTAIEGFADIEAMLRVWAVRLNTDDWDTWGTNRGKNCYLYRRPDTGLWVNVPWDMELTYNNVNAFPLGSTPSQAIPVNGLFPEVGRMLNRPRIKRRFYGILKEMVERQFNPEFLTAWMDLLQQNGTGDTGIGRAGGFIDQRAALLRGWLGPAVYPQQRLLVTTGGGNPFDSQVPVIDLAGDAPAEVRTIVVARNGAPLSPQPEIVLSTANLKGWTAKAITLAAGLNRIEFLGFGSEAENLVDSDSIDVTYTGSWNPPAVSEVDPLAGPTGAAIAIKGSDFHTGLKVFFGSIEAASVSFNEAADATRITCVVPAGLPPGSQPLKVRNSDGQTSNEVSFSVIPGFIRGDANLDGTIDLSDVLKTLLVLYASSPTTCQDALDADDSGTLGVSDAVRVLVYLFRDGPAPAAPFPQRGIDPTPSDPLTCEQGI